jgi:hypothetical protein
MERKIINRVINMSRDMRVGKCQQPRLSTPIGFVNDESLSFANSDIRI